MTFGSHIYCEYFVQGRTKLPKRLYQLDFKQLAKDGTNQRPRLSGSALKVYVGGVVQLITLSTPIQVEVELG